MSPFRPTISIPIALLVAASLTASLPVTSQANPDWTQLEEALEDLYSGNSGRLEDVYAEAYRSHPDETGRAETGAFLESLFAAFPDSQADIVIAIHEGNRAAFRYIFTGTFTNPLAMTAETTVPPTGEPIRLVQHSMVEVDENSRFVEAWTATDNLQLLQQLGVMPSEDAPPAGNATVEERITEALAASPAASGQEATHKALIDDLFAAFNAGDFDGARAFFAADFIQSDDGDTRDAEASIQNSMAMRRAFPDATMVAEEMVAEGRWVAVRYRMSGTFSGELQMPDGTTVPGTNNPVELWGISFYHFNDAQQIDLELRISDTLAYLQQVGLVQPPGQG